MFAGGKKETQASGFPQPVRTTQDRCASSLLESAQKAQSACRVRLQPSSSWMRPALEPAPALRRPAKANGAAPARRSLCLPFLSSTFIFNLRPAMASTRSPSPPGPATQSGHCCCRCLKARLKRQARPWRPRCLSLPAHLNLATCPVEPTRGNPTHSGCRSRICSRRPES